MAKGESQKNDQELKETVESLVGKVTALEDERFLRFLEEKLAPSRLADIPIERVVVTSSGRLIMTKRRCGKETCTCKVTKVDGKAPPPGWDCKCFRWCKSRITASFKGPKFPHWVGTDESSGAASPAVYVTNPDDGEVFEVEYECTCP